MSINIFNKEAGGLDRRGSFMKYGKWNCEGNTKY